MARKQKPRTLNFWAWDAQTGKKQHVLPGRLTGLTGAAYSPDGSRLATIGVKRNGKDKPLTWTIGLWDPDRGELLNEIDVWTWTKDIVMGTHKPHLPDIQFSDDGRWLVSSPALSRLLSRG